MPLIAGKSDLAYANGQGFLAKLDILGDPRLVHTTSYTNFA